MTRETKIGLIVAGSFLCLVGIVVASKWRGGDGTDAEEQTVVPGGILHPTQNPADAKSTAKSEPPKAGPIAALEKGKGSANERKAEQSKGLPGLQIPPASTPLPTPTPIEEDAILKEKEKERQEELRAALARNSGQSPAGGGVGTMPPLPSGGGVGTMPPLPSGGGVGTLPALPPSGGGVGTLPALPPSGGGVGTLPPLPPSGGGVGTLPPSPSSGGVGPLPPLPTPGGLGTPPEVGVGTLPPLPTQGGSGKAPRERGGAVPPMSTPGGVDIPQGGGVGTVPPLPTPGGLGTPPGRDVGTVPPLPTPGGLGALPAPSPFVKEDTKPLPPAPVAPGNLELKGVRPFDDKTQPAPFDPAGGMIPPKQLDPLPAPKGPTFGPLTPIPEATRPPAPPAGDPFNALPTTPGPIAVIPPTAGAVLPSPPIIVGGVRPSAAVTDVNIDIYECQKGDTTFNILSLRMYGTDKYADALLQYNREHSGMIKNGSTLNINPPILTPGQQVLKPPQTKLERDYASLIRTALPQIKILDTPTPLTPTPGPIAKVSNPPAAGPGGTYTVQNPAGESILDIAERVYGDRSQWHKIYRVNPNYPPQNRIPAGTTLTLPGN